MTGDQAIATHRRLLDQWRKAMDLVGPGPIEPHFQDAEGSVTGLDATGCWADLGSGAGFPGIALAARHPEAQVSLVESRQKRALFLHKVVAQSGLANATVVHGRTESLPGGHFDGIISRAYRPPPAVLADAARLLKPGGRIALLLGDGALPTLPPQWTDPQTHRYPVGKGWRMRLMATLAG
jgi:16S rRNA (guanine(527)-N(7))-methyltransferase RsmG